MNSCVFFLRILILLCAVFAPVSAEAQRVFFPNNAKIDYIIPVHNDVIIGYANRHDLDARINRSSPTVRLVFGGSIGGNVTVLNGSVFRMVGGNVNGMVQCGDDSTTYISGGNIGTNFSIGGRSILNIYGTNLSSALEWRIAGLARYTISGTLVDGTILNAKPLHISEHPHESASFHLYNINTVIISGVISLQSVSNSGQDVLFTFRNMAGVTFTRVATLDMTGNYTLSNIPAGYYTVAIKGAKWLRKNITIDGSVGNVTDANASLLAGDANDDNFADITDLLTLIAHYNHSVPNTGFLDAADFNCDGINDITDLLLLIGNYNKQGDPLP
jgi:hypothetical protein